MPFSLNSAVAVKEEELPMIDTTSFNAATARAIPEKPKPNTEPGFFAKVLRSVFSGSPIEQIQTQSYLLDKIRDGTIPDERRRPNESMSDFEIRSKESFAKMDEVLAEREKEIAGEGIGRVLEAPMQLGIFATGMGAPIETAAFLGGFALKDHIFNARNFVESKFPNASGNVKDMVEIADLVLSGAAIGGGIFKAKQIMKNRLDSLNLPTNVEVKPEHISAIKKSTALTAEEKNAVISTLGMEQKHVDASLSNNLPVKVPLDNMIDLAQTPHWEKTKEILARAEEKIAEMEAKKDVPREITKTPEETAIDKIDTVSQILKSYESAIKEGDLDKAQELEIMLSQRAKNFTPEEEQALTKIKNDAPIPDFSQKENSTEVAYVYGDRIKDNAEKISEVEGRIAELNKEIPTISDQAKKLWDEGNRAESDALDVKVMAMTAEKGKLNEVLEVAKGTAGPAKQSGIKIALENARRKIAGENPLSADEMKKIMEVKPSVPSVPKGLEALAAEAKKYKTAEEFSDAMGLPKSGFGFKDIYRKYIGETNNSGFEFPKLNEHPAGENLPDKITVYRGIRASAPIDKKIGEYFSLDKEEAQTYGENIQTFTASKNDFRVNPHVPGIHLVYLPEGIKPKDTNLFNSQIPSLADFYDKATERLSSESGQLRLPEVSPEQSESIYQKTVNRFQSIENIVDKAKELGADIPAGENAGLSAARYLSNANQADNALKFGTFKISPDGKIQVTGEGLKPILDDFDKSIPEMDLDTRRGDLKNYLIARRTIEDLQRPKNEFTDENIVTPEQVADAQQKIGELTGIYGDNLNKFNETATRIYDFQKRVLQSLVDSGNMSQEQFDLILEKNPNYIPFDRILPEETPLGGTPVNKNRFSGAKSPVKKIKGSELEIHDPVESIIKNTYKIMDTASRNKVFKDIYNLRNIEELGITKAKIQMRPINVGEAETGADATTIFRPSPFKPKGNVVEGWIDGKRTYLEVPKNIYEAMTGLDEQSSSILVKILSKPAAWLRTGATITPEFILRNPIRDQWTALLQTHVGFKPFLDPVGAISDILGKKEIYNDWIRSGGSYSGFVELSRPALKKMASELVNDKSLISRLNIVQSLGELSQFFEQATRLGVYKAAIRSGLNPIEAAKQSREATVDFSRRGSKTRDINGVVAFFNAGIQGLDKSVRTAAQDPIGLTAKAVATITVPSLLLYLKNRQDADYKEIPRWQRDLFFMTKINGTWIRIPKPFLYGQIFGSLPERFFEYLDTKDPQAFDKFQDSLYNSLSPIAGDPIEGLLPTAIKPLIENETNWSFFRGRPIVSDTKKELIPSQQFSQYDTETAKILGAIFKVSPSKIENLTQGYFGGSGRYALQGGDQLIKLFNKASGKEEKPKKPTELSDVPLVKGFVARNPLESPESLQKFYDHKTKISQLSKTYDLFKKNKEKEKAAKLKMDHPEIKFVDDFEEATKDISEINKKIDKVSQSKNFTDDEKREKTQNLFEKRLRIATKVNKKLDRMERP